MKKFIYKACYEEMGKHILELDILPEKYCTFDCVFCPVGRSHHQTEEQQSFGDMTEVLLDLEHRIDSCQPDLIFINSKGEALIHDKLVDIIRCIQHKNLPIRLLSNGYLLGKTKYMEIADLCDEVIGELKVVTEKDFQQMQRPIQGYTLKTYLSNMIEFREQYTGIFIFEITIINGHNSDDESVRKIKNILDKMHADVVKVITMEDKPFKKKMGISKERLTEIKLRLLQNKIDTL